jgi:hypothetical protein
LRVSTACAPKGALQFLDGPEGSARPALAHGFGVAGTARGAFEERGCLGHLKRVMEKVSIRKNLEDRGKGHQGRIERDQAQFTQKLQPNGDPVRALCGKPCGFERFGLPNSPHFRVFNEVLQFHCMTSNTENIIIYTIFMDFIICIFALLGFPQFSGFFRIDIHIRRQPNGVTKG